MPVSPLIWACGLAQSVGATGVWVITNSAQVLEAQKDPGEVIGREEVPPVMLGGVRGHKQQGGPPCSLRKPASR
jgi:hypothetical protein